jgi:hypothetical protein
MVINPTAFCCSEDRLPSYHHANFVGKDKLCVRVRSARLYITRFRLYGFLRCSVLLLDPRRRMSILDRASFCIR